MSLVYAYEIYAEHRIGELRREARLEALRDQARLAAAPGHSTFLGRLKPIAHALRIPRGITRRLAMS